MFARLHRIYGWVCENGESYCYLENKVTRLPHFRSLYYVTTRIRGRSLSLSAMEAAYNAINVLLDYCDEYSVDLEARFRRREYLLATECESLHRHCQKRFDRHANERSTTVVPIKSGKKGHKPPVRTVSKSNEHTRLTEIAGYLKWLAADVLTTTFDADAAAAVERMYLNLLELRPPSKGRNGNDADPGLTDEQIAILRRIVKPGSELNPFEAAHLQVRNHLLVELFLELGKRTGELLNLRGEDVDWSKGILHIRRRPDEKIDRRRRKARVKTLAHSVPIGPPQVELLRNYAQVRKSVPGASKTPYIFVTHKAGPTQGRPMTISGLQQVFAQIRAVEPRLAGWHPHANRHTWNRRLSEKFDNGEIPVPASQQENIRSNLQGWKEGSGTAATYDKRHRERMANRAGLAMQQRTHEASGSKPKRNTESIEEQGTKGE